MNQREKKSISDKQLLAEIIHHDRKCEALAYVDVTHTASGALFRPMGRRGVEQKIKEHRFACRRAAEFKKEALKRMKEGDA